jgi:hypothetical protein
MDRVGTYKNNFTKNPLPLLAFLLLLRDGGVMGIM